MTSHFLRIEGVNLGAFIDDTQDLSTMRGSSLLLLDAIEAVEAMLCGRATTITKGASAELFRLDDRTSEAALELRDALEWTLATGQAADPLTAPNEDRLREALCLARFATFAVDVVASDEPERGFRRAAEQAVAMNRWRQMQAPTLAAGLEGWPTEVIPDLEDRVCFLSHVRPAMAKQRRIKGDERRPVSASVYERRGFGINRKHRLYNEMMKAREKEGWQELKLPDGFPEDFARDMDEVSEPERPDVLRGKIALLYADGNRFSKVQRAYVDGDKTAGFGQIDPEDTDPARAIERQRAFDCRMRHLRRKLLWRLLRRLWALRPHTHDPDAPAYPGRDKPKRGILRLETQLWGGDELIWVVPASAGWAALELFFADTMAQEADGAPRWRVGRQPISHAVAVVFCHHDAPIARVRDLARYELAELCKAQSRDRSLLAYQVLESFDHIGRDFRRLLAERTPPRMDEGIWTIPGEQIELLHELACALASARFPRRQLKRLAQVLHEEGVGKRFCDAETDACQEARAAAPDEWAEAAELLQRFESSPLGRAVWLHLDQLWDYLTVKLSPGAGS